MTGSPNRGGKRAECEAHVEIFPWVRPGHIDEYLESGYGSEHYIVHIYSYFIKVYASQAFYTGTEE